MNIVTLVPLLGKKREVCAVARHEVETPIFVEELYSLLSDANINKMETYIDHLAEYPFPFRNPSTIKKLRHAPGIWELRPYPVRLFFFMVHLKQVIITNGIIKDQNTTPQKAIDKAIFLMEQYKREV